MAERVHQTDPLPPNPAPARESRRWLWLVLFFLILLVGGSVLAAKYLPGKKPEPEALDGKLIVVVRGPEQRIDAHLVEEPGALPVRPGGIMSLEVEYTQPAYTYLIWIDSEGQLLPLYPWNPDTLEVRDVNQPPPVRKPTNRLYSPPIGGGWKFGNKSGVETVLLLARRTPIEDGTKFGALIGTLPPPKLRHREELVVFGWNRGADSISTLLAQHRGAEEESRAVDEPFQATLLRLRDHFELIQAVRFAHTDGSESKKK